MKNVGVNFSTQIVGVIIGLVWVFGSVSGVRQLQQQEECSDISPNELYTCEEQQKWGKCNEEWIIQGQFCQRTCGRCATSSQSSAYHSGCQDVQVDGMSCQEYKDMGKCSEQNNNQKQSFCDITCGRCQDASDTQVTSETDSVKQCRLTNCTVIDFYGNNPFQRRGRKLLYAYARAEVSSSVFVNPQRVNNQFAAIPISYQQVQGTYANFLFPQIIITEDKTCLIC
eukprot:TRINITY_DN19084_c0_g2_i4.p2 TRINITY_DN19084_c0_g2~~TRINITY_DN19084_c0_g2_i4.p2  ORF type:complete len:226 (-),score=9.28 TRINITY_DN19084_c0_g2_i4:75-752(-)